LLVQTTSVRRESLPLSAQHPVLRLLVGANRETLKKSHIGTST
jgi:hypothetical protein